jgi:CheY-like chemotaxis protein
MNNSPVLLHVDDDEDSLELSRSQFERLLPGVDVLTRTDAESALATLSMESVDTVVSDSIELPDGTPFVEAARNAYPELPIVLYTGREFTDAAPVITQAGVTEYVQKRADTTPQTLVDRVQRHLSADDTPATATRSSHTPPAHDSTSSTGSKFDDVSNRVAPERSDEWTELARCDPTSVDDLVVTLVNALGEQANERPLVELFDAEALARVFASQDADPPTQFRVRLDTHEVVVTNTGLVATRPLTPA